MAGPASSFSSSFTYDVFLSFRGADTRLGFTGNLYKALLQRGIHTFIDDEELQRGDEITPSLVNAIQESRIAIPVFSHSYASSAFCLDELVNIIECVKEKGRLVLPVFYDVDPSIVRHHRGTYGEALAMLEERFEDDVDKVQKWRKALHQAANLSGYHFKHGDGYEYEFIGRIVEEVSRKINLTPLHVADYPVGLESRVLQVNSLLQVGSADGVHMVGIYGIGGIGKTTLARAVYNLIAGQFEGSCFLHDVGENSVKHGLVHLQETLLSEIVAEKDIRLGSINKGISIIKHRLHRKKVLLILDDVDKLEQLQAIVGGPGWFGSGSKVIITTQDKHLLASHGIEKTYGVDGLNKKEALELLSYNAFKNDKVDPSHVDVLNRAVAYASGLPLALEIIGSNLFGKKIEEWESALDRYERIPNKEIQKILKASFDALEEDEQKIFLDIACCFKGYKLADIEDILRAHHGVSPKYSIGVLLEKSLIKINRFGQVTLHDLIQDMGKEIVQQESPKEPGKRSRLWFPEDIVRVLKENMGTSEIEIINLDFPAFEEVVEWDGETFKKMTNLKTLIIRNGLFSEGPKHLPNSLRVLEWWGYPSQSLPSDFHPEKLAIFKLPNNCFMSLELFGLQKMFMEMRVLNLDSCKYITEIPNVSGVPNLEELSFRDCEYLIKIHESVGFLDKLRILDADGCSKLSSFPPIKLTSLEQLHLSKCSSLESFPEILGKMENITDLELFNTAIKELPVSIQNLTRLQNFLLEHCGIVQLPNSIFMLPELDELDFGACDGLLLPKQDKGEEHVSSMVFSNTKRLVLSNCNISDEFLQIGLAWFPNVKYLNLSSNNFTILPTCIKECRFLRELYLNDCENLREIRGIPPNIEKLSAYNCRTLSSSSRSMLLNEELHEAGNKMFYLPGTMIPEWFEHRSKWSSISFWFRNKFPAVSICLVTRVDAPIFTGWLRLTLTINGMKKVITKEGFFHRFFNQADHILIFGRTLINLEDNADEVLLGNEWNHVEFSSEDRIEPFVKQIGLHVFKQESSIDDIQFTDPYKKRRTSIRKFMQQQNNLASVALLEPHVGQGGEWLSLLQPSALKDNVNCDSNSMVSTRISSATSVPGCKIGTLRLDNVATEHFCQAPSKVVLDSDSITSTLASNTASEGAVTKDLIMAFCLGGSANVKDSGSNIVISDHPVEAQPKSQVTSFMETPSVQEPGAAIYSDKVNRGELPQNTSSIMVLPTAIDFLRNQTNSPIDEVEMEAFYASLDAETETTVLSLSNNTELANRMPSEKTQQALKTLQDFLTKDFSVLLGSGEYNAMKATLDYLTNEEDRMSVEIRSLIIEVSRQFTRWGGDYTNECKKIEYTTAKLLKADEVEEGLEANKDHFREVIYLENELCNELAYLEERKKELEEQINAIKANISASQSTRNIVTHRKRKIFGEAKMLKAQRDGLKEQVPRLRDEQELAKKNQANIRDEWLKLGEKFNRSFRFEE